MFSREQRPNIADKEGQIPDILLTGCLWCKKIGWQAWLNRCVVTRVARTTSYHWNAFPIRTDDIDCNLGFDATWQFIKLE